ncbi:MAG: GMP synthase, partial [Bacteroidetes bacterium]
MTHTGTTRARLALLDMYAGEPNLGMGRLREITAAWREVLTVDEFDVRGKGEVPDLSYDIYLSSGGPGSPLPTGEDWEQRWYALVAAVHQHNAARPDRPKFFFFICHSFQMACLHFGVGEVRKRRAKSFGTFPVYKTPDGRRDPLFAGLPDPFWVADFREYQVVDVQAEQLARSGARLLAIEQERVQPHLPRAAMAVRFSSEMVGVQFHPEADSAGMLLHFSQEERKQAIIEEYGAERYYEMLAHLADPDKIELTHQVVLPGFLERSLRRLGV